MDMYLTVLGRFVAKNWYLVIAAFLLLIPAAVFEAQNVSLATGNRTIISPESEIYKDFEKYSENFGSDPIVVLVKAEDVRQLLENLPAMDRLEAKLNENENVLSAMGPAFALKQLGGQQMSGTSLPADFRMAESMLLDKDTGQLRPQFARLFPQGQYAVIRVTLRGNLEREALRAVVDDVTRATEKAGFGSSVTAKVTGVPAATVTMQNMMQSSSCSTYAFHRRSSTWLSHICLRGFTGAYIYAARILLAMSMSSGMPTSRGI